MWGGDKRRDLKEVGRGSEEEKGKKEGEEGGSTGSGRCGSGRWFLPLCISSLYNHKFCISLGKFGLFTFIYCLWISSSTRCSGAEFSELLKGGALLLGQATALARPVREQSFMRKMQALASSNCLFSPNKKLNFLHWVSCSASRRSSRASPTLLP